MSPGLLLDSGPMIGFLLLVLPSINSQASVPVKSLAVKHAMKAG